MSEGGGRVTLGGLDVLLYTITFLVPGYVLYSTLTAFGRHKPIEAELAFLRFLTLGAVHNAPWAALIYLLLREHLHSRAAALDYFRRHAFWAALMWLLLVLVSPLVVGIVYSRLRRSAAAARIADIVLGVRPLDVNATAWDYGFERGWANLYLGVTLTDGSVVYGRFGTRSFATAAASGKDIHLEEVWDVDDEGNWTRPTEPAGVTIAGASIQTVTFWGEPFDQEGHGNEQTQ